MNDNKIPAVFSYIASRRNDMTLRENEIANFVLKNPEFIVNNTITNIANEVGVSETSINRFCKKIGYKGFKILKLLWCREVFIEISNLIILMPHNLYLYQCFLIIKKF